MWENYLALVPIAMLTWVAIRTAKKMRKKKEIEENLPRALLELSAMRITTMKDIVRHLSRGYGALSREFKKVERLMASGIPPDKAMRTIARDTDTYLLTNAVSIIITGMRSGADLSELFRKTAEDMECLVDMERERTSALTLQKYVTLLSAGVFVPLVLGITKRMTDRLIATTMFEASPLLTSVQSAVFVHIVALTVLSSVFAAVLDGDMKRSIIYAALLIPLAVVTYTAAGGWVI